MHSTVFDLKAPLFDLARSFYTVVDKCPPRLQNALHLAEHTAKKPLFDCQDCGDCSLAEIAYLCPESQCAKNQRNGPCGGTHDGLCEVADKECIWARAYERLKPYGEEDSMLEGPSRLQQQRPSWHERLGQHFPGKGPHSPFPREGGSQVSVTGQDFVVIGENIHATRVLLKKSERIACNEQGEEGIVFTDEDGTTAHLRIPEEEKGAQAYLDGRIKHVRIAVQVAMTGDEPDRSVALSYLRRSPSVRSMSGAHFLDVNVDEISNKLEDQLEAMSWLAGCWRHSPTSRSRSTRPTSRSRRWRGGGSRDGRGRVGPPMLNSASLERIEALDLAARLEGPVVVTAAGESGMPTNSEERVANASRIIEASLEGGIPLGRIFVDPLVFPIAVDGEYGRHCLDAIAELRRRYGAEIHITGGMSNVSFGLPNRRLLNDAFLVLATEAGADSAIVDPTVASAQRALAANREARPFQLALDVLTGVDENCHAYMKAHRTGELVQAAS